MVFDIKLLIVFAICFFPVPISPDIKTLRLFLITLTIESKINLVFSVFSKLTIFKLSSWIPLLLLFNLSISDFKLEKEKGLFIVINSRYLKILMSKLCKFTPDINTIDIFFFRELISEKKLKIFSIKFSFNNIISILFSVIVSLIFSKLFLKNLSLYKSLKYLFNKNKKLSSESANKILMFISYFY